MLFLIFYSLILSFYLSASFLLWFFSCQQISTLINLTCVLPFHFTYNEYNVCEHLKNHSPFLWYLVMIFLTNLLIIFLNFNLFHLVLRTWNLFILPHKILLKFATNHFIFYSFMLNSHYSVFLMEIISFFAEMLPTRMLSRSNFFFIKNSKVFLLREYLFLPHIMW